MIKPRYEYIICELGRGEYLHKVGFYDYKEAKKVFDDRYSFTNYEITANDRIKYEYIYDIGDSDIQTKQELFEDGMNPLFDDDKCNTDCPFMGNYGGRYSCGFPDWHLFPMGFKTPNRRIKCINKFNK